MTDEGKIKSRIQAGIVTVSALLMAGKFFAFMLTNSVGILTDALESIVNVAAGFISLWSISHAARPSDHDHPFGHGKIELISASLEALMIMTAGGIIVFEGIVRLFSPAKVASLDVGIWIVAGAGAVNFLLGWYSVRMGRKYSSVALVAGGKHLKSDTYSSIGLVAGLVLLYFTKIGWIDSALALVFGGIIMLTGIGILRKTISNLVDSADRATLEDMVAMINRDRHEEWIDVHNMKSISYGSYIFVTCDLTLPWYYTVRESHSICNALRDTILREFDGRVMITIHSDPCRTPAQCRECIFKECTKREAPFRECQPLTLAGITETDDNREEL